MDGSSAGLLAAPLVAPMRSDKAFATSLMALISTTCQKQGLLAALQVLH